MGVEAEAEGGEALAFFAMWDVGASLENQLYSLYFDDGWTLLFLFATLRI